MELHEIHFSHDAIATFCEANGIARLSLYGSILRDDFGPESDIDMLVEFLPDRTPDLFSIARMESELGEMFGRKVDLRTARELSHLFRDKVIAESMSLHAA